MNSQNETPPTVPSPKQPQGQAVPTVPSAKKAQSQTQSTVPSAKNFPNETKPTIPATKNPQEQLPLTEPSTASAPGFTRDQTRALKQSMNQDELRAMQEGAPNTTREVQQGMKANYPNWPTSHPGPLATPPPPGQKPINAIRAEQVVEVGYNQVTGEPSTTDPARYVPDANKGPASFDQQESLQDVHKKRKERL